MAAIVNTRDLRLQATVPRVVPIPIPIENVEGLPAALDNAAANAKGLRVTSTGSQFNGSTPSSITLTAVYQGGLTGAVVWSLASGAATLATSGSQNETCTIQNSTMTSLSLIVVATVTSGGKNYTAQYILTKLGELSKQDKINLTNQIVGKLANSDVTGLGALALLNQIDLNSQTTGALNYLQVNGLGALATQSSVNAYSQVTNLGNLAYANAIAANQVGAGQLAAGVIYAGYINASQITASGTITGVNLVGGARVAAGGVVAGSLYQFDASSAYGPFVVRINGADLEVRSGPNSGPEALIVRGDGSVVTVGPQEFRITASYFSGGLGERIMLKGVTYTVTLNGDKATFS